MSWRPIETAPRDQRVLAYNPYTGPYITSYVKGEWPMNGWGSEFGMWYPRPTHWQPLPAAPISADSDTPTASQGAAISAPDGAQGAE